MEEVLTLLFQKKYSEVKRAVSQMHDADVAELFDEIPDRETKLRLFRLLSKEMAAGVFSYMESDAQQAIIEALTDTELNYILENMYMDDFVDLVEEMPANVVQRVMKNAGRENRSLINQYLKYPDDSAGSIMTNEYVYFRANITVQQAFSVIRETGLEKETVYTCYVIDGERRLLGEVTALSMLLADPNAVIDSIRKPVPATIHTLDDQEDVAKLFQKYDMLAMPVVDNEERLVGIITIDDAVDVLQEENTEDFEKMAGMAPSEDSYMHTPILTLAKNRILWLMILMISAMITGSLLEKYEAAIAAIPLLVSFIPMLMDTGGNSGSQASTMIIRGMALDEIEPKNFVRVWLKEIRVALICSAALSLVNFLRIWIQYRDIGVAATVSITLIATICIAKSLGVALPMLAKKLKLDPAITASPMITTITDACTIFVFFTLAARILAGRL